MFALISEWQKHPTKKKQKKHLFAFVACSTFSLSTVAARFLPFYAPCVTTTALVASFLLRAGPRSQISNNTTLGYAFLQNTVTCYQCAKYCKTYYQSSRSLFTVTHSVKLKFVGKMQEISQTAKDSETAVGNVPYVFIGYKAAIL